MTYELIHGDARHVSQHVAAESVDLIVTSPPYFALRSYRDGGEHYDGQIGSEPTPTDFIDVLVACTADWMTVLKSGGSIWVNLGDKYAGSNGQSGGTGEKSPISGGKSANPDVSVRRGYVPKSSVPAKSLMGLPWRYAIRCVDELCLILRAEVVWAKPNGIPESVTDRVSRSHEQWFHFTKQPRYFSAVDEIREPHNYDGKGLTWEDGKAQANRYSPDAGHGSGGMSSNPLGKLPGSVWTVPTEPLRVPKHLGIDHFAAFPSEWPRRIILGWSPEGGTVLDPFGGTGTTAAVAHHLGRHGIHIDLSRDYLRLAEWRINHDENLRRKVLERSGRPTGPANPNQLDLFGGVA